MIFIGTHVNLASTGNGVKLPGIAIKVSYFVIGHVVARINGRRAILKPQVARGAKADRGLVNKKRVHILVARTGIAALHDGVGDSRGTSIIMHLTAARGCAIAPEDAIGQNGGIEVVGHPAATVGGRIAGKCAVGHNRGGGDVVHPAAIAACRIAGKGAVGHTRGGGVGVGHPATV